MQVRNNIAAINTYRNLSNTSTQMQKTYEKLSSGYAINKAADDSAGLSISEKMRGQINGLTQASENIQDGISLLNVAESGLGQIQNPNLIRMRELAVQAANDTLTDDDRALIQQEVEQIKNGIDDIANNTEFNMIPLLNQLGKSSVVTPENGIGYIANKYIVALNVSGDGSFDLKTNQGFPNTTADDNKALIFGNGRTYTQPSILVEDDTGNIRQYYLKQNSLSIETKQVGETFETIYDLPNNIQVKQIVSLKEEKFQFNYDLINNSSTSQKVGFQFQMDTMLDYDDNAKFTLDNNPISQSNAWTSNLPTTFGIYNNNGNASLKAEGIVAGASNGILIDPDEFRVGNQDTVKIYDGFNRNDYIGDGGYAVIWNPKELAPSSTKTVNTFYGLGVPPNVPAEVWPSEELVDPEIILQVGPNEGHELKIRLTDARAQTLGIDQLDMSTREGAEAAIKIIDAASNAVSSERSRFGAYVNRLEHIQNNVSNYTEALTSAESRIRDADIAKQMTELQKQQVLLQSAQSMTAQSNQMSQGILQLLQ